MGWAVRIQQRQRPAYRAVTAPFTTTERSAKPPAMKRSLSLRTALLLLATGCIVEAPGAPTGSKTPSPEMRTARPAVVAPALNVKLGANLEDKVEIVGATVQPGQLSPGEQGKVTAYFKVLAPIPQDYMVFVHVEDMDGKAERLNVDHAPMGGLHPTSQWKPGELVKDEFNVYVPPGMQTHGLNLWVGFWQPQTDQRLRLKNTEQVKNDGSNRILLVSIPVVQ